MQLSIIKIGGNIIDDEARLAGVPGCSFTAFPGKKILVHGGGKLATRVQRRGLGIRQQLVDGRRITDAETLKSRHHGLCRHHQQADRRAAAGAWDVLPWVCRVRMGMRS
jgi:acetylglutamate kinase